MPWKITSFAILLCACAPQQNTQTTPPAAQSHIDTLAPAEQAEAYFTQKDFTKAAAAYQEITRAEPENGKAWLRLALSLHYTNHYQEALSAYQVAEELKVAPQVVLYNMACAYALLGKTDEALSHLERAVAAGFGQLATLQNDTDLSSLHGDPRFEKLLAQVKKNQSPCDTPAHQQFDFWLGDWSVSSAGFEVGQSHIEKILGGCVLLENWTDKGGSQGKSFNSYHPDRKQWQQSWVDDKGHAVVYVGEWKDGVLRFTSEAVDQSGNPTYTKMTFTPIDQNTVRQLIETSPDQKTWTSSFDGLYQRKK